MLSRAEVVALLGAPMPIKARTFLMTAYASGLRLNELCHLRGCDIDGSTNNAALALLAQLPCAPQTTVPQPSH
ncbi:hypothetical protein [Polaromonas sp. CG_9.11]|uniref:hypothetical protein n=1 Tax=Polaromonas sp. CG_9.11 TaxID=2787730 RepID=UPI001E44270A|nr:hypothetical protein [Polaromonas sp. CG_9.11]